MGKGIISNIRLCVYFKKYSTEDIRYVKQFILFNTNKYFIRDLSIAVEANNKTLYLPPQPPQATVAENNSIGVKYKNNYYLFPTNNTAHSTVLTVDVYIKRNSSGRTGSQGYLQMTKGGNTFGLNYKIKWEVLTTTLNKPIPNFEIGANESMGTKSWVEYTGVTSGSINTIRLSCEASDDYYDFTVDFGKEICFQRKTFTFDLQER